MTEEIKFNEMTMAHIEQVMEIENASFATPYSRKMMEDEVDNKLSHYLVAELDGQVVAFGGFWHICDEGHIINIAVSPQHRRMGLGEKLLAKLIQRAKELEINSMTLEVRVSNVAAQGLYSKLGFVTAGIRKQYYEDNREDAIIMWNNDINSTDGDR
jgi:ribosomal-protein-alanine N-acetyltransferase